MDARRLANARGHLKRRGMNVIAIGGTRNAERKYLEDVWQGVTAIHQLEWPDNTALLRKRYLCRAGYLTTHLAAAAGCPTVAFSDPPTRVSGAPAGPRTGQAMGRQRPEQNRGNVWIVQDPLPCLPCTFEGCERNIASRTSVSTSSSRSR